MFHVSGFVFGDDPFLLLLVVVHLLEPGVCEALGQLGQDKPAHLRRLRIFISVQILGA